MTIYDINGAKKKEELMQKIQPLPKVEEETLAQDVETQDRFFSSLVARLFFLLLWSADIGWFFYSSVKLLLWGTIFLVTFGKFEVVREKVYTSTKSLKRSLICGIALFVALFNPSLGIMIACTYFLMYDPSGIEEVVPASLQDQFKGYFK